MEKVLSTTSGRYKAFKLIQYVSRFILLVTRHKRITISQDGQYKLRTLIGQCSLQRRILQLGNAYAPLKALFVAKSTNWSMWSGTLTGLMEDLSEDAATLAHLGWIPKRFAHLAIYADRAWLLSLILDLHAWAREKRALMTSRRLNRMLDQRPKSADGEQKLKQEEWWLDLDGIRTMCDAGQAWCDVFDVEVFDGFVVICALTSSILAMYRFVAKP